MTAFFQKKKKLKSPLLLEYIMIFNYLIDL